MQVRYNQKRVNNFSRLRCEKLIFFAWKAYSLVRIKVNRLFQRKLSTFLSNVFTSWRDEAKHTRIVRRNVYENWAGYTKLMINGPFQAWAEYVRGLKNQFVEHIRIARAYRQWKTRQQVGEIIRRWRHLSLFGRLDGLYSRQMLLKSLGEQKIHSHTLEKVMSDQTIELEECKQIVLRETEKRKELEVTLTKAQKEVQRERMQSHNFQQECERLDALVNAIKKVCPKQVEHLLTLQPRFRFRERPVAMTPLADGTQKDQNQLTSRLDDDQQLQDGQHEQKQEGQAEAQGQGSQGELLPSDVMSAPLDLLEEQDEEQEQDDRSDGVNGAVLSPEIQGHHNNGNIVVDTPQATERVQQQCVDQGTQTELSGSCDNDESPLSARPLQARLHTTQIGETLSIEDEKLLERTKWLVERYRVCLLENEQEEEEREELEEAKKRETIDTMLAMSSEMSMPDTTASSPLQTDRKNNLLRQSNPFARCNSKSSKPFLSIVCVVEVVIVVAFVVSVYWCVSHQHSR